uniref:Putative secreted protein n=1 Tax=Lutzomyia longipalpis TaxID=7200 RepID=A0A7G3AQ74_LUTLO
MMLIIHITLCLSHTESASRTMALYFWVGFLHRVIECGGEQYFFLSIYFFLFFFQHDTRMERTIQNIFFPEEFSL